MDGWDGYTSDRQRVLDHVRDTDVRNPVVLSGDLHSHVIADLKTDFRDERVPTVATEFVTAGISSPSFDDLSPYQPDNPHVRFTANKNGYLWLRVGRKELHAEVRVMHNRSAKTTASRGEPASVSITSSVHHREPAGVVLQQKSDMPILRRLPPYRWIDQR